MDQMLLTIILSAAAGIVGTGLGGLAGLLFKKSGDGVVSSVISFSAGVMLAVVFFELLPGAIDLSNVYTTIAFAFVGAAVVFLLGLPSKRFEDKQFKKGGDDRPRRQTAMLRSGLLMAAAIALHNLPEGLAIGSGSAWQSGAGAALAATIAFHNVAEGIAISVPLVEGGMKGWKAVILTALSGLPTLFGGLLGYLLGGISNFALAASLGAAGGAMLYVTFIEMFPQASALCKTRRPWAVALFGVLCGAILVKAFE